MPELPDIETYLHCLRPRILRRTLQGIRLANPFLLRTVEPPIRVAEGKRVAGLERLGKRVVIGLEDPSTDQAQPFAAGEGMAHSAGGQDLFLVLHLMIAGRLHWRGAGAKLPFKVGLAAFDFPNGSLVLTEAGSKRRASLHLVAGRDALRDMDRGGLEVLDADAAAFRDALHRENHTLKRSLTDPRLFSGIGNAYSDEIFHRARLSPLKLTKQLREDEAERLYHACRDVLVEWTARLKHEAGDGFPERVTAFRAEFATHGRYAKPCPVCGTSIQRIVYAENECNYCPTCQTDGRLLADRSLSRLLKEDWPKTLEEMEERKAIGMRRGSAAASL